MNSLNQTCPECGAALPRGYQENSCPKCLLQIGLNSPSGTHVDAELPTLVSARTKSSQSGEQPQSERNSLGTIRYFGDYELLEEIARGGMGVVYKARQTSLNRVVAIKMILSGQLASEQDIKRFHAEAEAAAQLDHPGIVPIYEIGEHERQHFFSMGLVEGRSLSEALRDGPLAARKAATIAKSIAEAVAYAHHRGVIHRDLKPANVLLDQQEQPKVTDFGLAKQTGGDSNLTATGQVLGTPAYMPPEQAGSRPADIGPASDVYSIGAMLYEMLTGQPPFTADAPIDIVMKVLESNPVPVRSLNANVPVDLETICFKCLEKNTLRRYATAGELAAELARFLAQEPIHARPVGRLQKLWSWSKRRPWSITTVACTFILGLVTATWWLWTDNAYLRYQISHADYVREAGPRTDQLEQALEVYAPIPFMAVTGCFIALMLQVNRRRSTGKPLSTQLLFWGSAVSVLGVGLALYLTTKSIEAHVWEGSPLFRAWSTIYMSILFGGWFLVRSYRQYDTAVFGTVWEPSLELTDDEVDELRELLLQQKKILAVRRVRKWKSAGLPDAKRTVDRIEVQLHHEFPDLGRSVAKTNRSNRLKFVVSITILCFLGALFFASNLHPSRMVWIVAFIAVIGVIVLRFRSLGDLGR